jgi:molybdopterin/thiamine biosynthesis adenylyltransferase
MNKVTIRIPEKLYDNIYADLLRPHKFASERVGFTFSKTKILENGEIIICMNEYTPIDDGNYIMAPSVGAKFNSLAITNAIGYGRKHKKGIFHTHLHELSKRDPEFSFTDLEHLPPIVESANRIVKEEIHGLFLLSQTTLSALVWIPGEEGYRKVDQISIVGATLKLSFPSNPLRLQKLERYNRQSFLGEYSEAIFSRIRVGIVGLGGGGSHIVQQLAHLGIKHYSLFDDDVVDESNLNRLVSATLLDFENSVSKFDVAKRTIESLHKDANIRGGNIKWELDADSIDSCDIVIGCLDTLHVRRDLEAESRRYLIPLIDIGMGIDRPEDGPASIYGQVHLSLPGECCLICRGFLNQDDLTKEAERYGEDGGRPQVVWSNGILASNAIGVLAEVITNWTKLSNKLQHLTYEGNYHIIKPSIYLKTYGEDCIHYPIESTGPVNL